MTKTSFLVFCAQEECGRIHRQDESAGGSRELRGILGRLSARRGEELEEIERGTGEEKSDGESEISTVKSNVQ